MNTTTTPTICRHCQRTIVTDHEGVWIDPAATGDDSIWRETCDAHDTFQAEHEPFTFDVDAIVADLEEDGNTHVVHGALTAHVPTGTWTFTLHVEPDDMTLLDEQGEGVWCGRLEWGRTNDYGHYIRPRDFTGRAEIILRDRSQRLWWEVPADVEIGSELHANLRRNILDVLTYGYRYFYVTLTHDRDGYTRTWRSGGLGGLEPFGEIPGDYLADQIADLIDEITS